MSEATRGSIKFDLRTFLPLLTETQIKALMDGVAIETGDADSSPLISCVMPFGETRRRKPAQKAIMQFAQQTYTNKQLVIANTTGSPLLAQSVDGIKELMLNEELSIGMLRNRGIDAADGDWIKHWDDDDAYDVNFLSFLMAHRVPGKAVMLRYQIRVDSRKATAFRHEDAGGVPNTILFPKTDARYGDIDAGDDVAFVLANWSEKCVVVNNAAFPSTLMNIAVYHGGNVTSERSFMGEYAEPQHAAKWYLSLQEQPVLIQVLDGFGLKTTVKTLPPENEPMVTPPAADAQPVA